MKENTEFSVSVCVYKNDSPEDFKTAIESVIDQTVPPSQIVIVVDGEISKSLDAVVSNFEKNTVFDVVRLPKNTGHGNARRAGLEKCKHELVAIMDADDIATPERFEKQLEMFEKNEKLCVCGGNIAEFEDTPENVISYRCVPSENDEIRKYMKKRCPFNQMTVMFKKSEVMAVGGYVDWFRNEDYYLWLRLMQNDAEFANSNEIFAKVRVEKDTYYRRGGLHYFKSEYKLQKYMLENHIIDRVTYTVNILKRFTVQVLLPGKMRRFVYNNFAREKTKNK